jgi:hypothetical protein
MFIVITGNPLDGFNHYGPFNTLDEALRWGEDYYAGGDWWITKLSLIP